MRTSSNRKLFSDTVNFDLFLCGDAFFHEEQGEFLPEVALQLNNDALLLVLDDRAIAMEHLFECAHEFLIVQVIRQPLYNGQALAPATLLVMQMDHVVLISLLGLVFPTEVYHVRRTCTENQLLLRGLRGLGVILCEFDILFGGRLFSLLAIFHD